MDRYHPPGKLKSGGKPKEKNDSYTKIRKNEMSWKPDMHPKQQAKLRELIDILLSKNSPFDDPLTDDILADYFLLKAQLMTLPY